LLADAALVMQVRWPEGRGLVRGALSSFAGHDEEGAELFRAAAAIFFPNGE